MGQGAETATPPAAHAANAGRTLSANMPVWVLAGAFFGILTGLTLGAQNRAVAQVDFLDEDLL